MRLAGPLSVTGTPLHGSVTTGRPFYVRVELFTDTAGAAAVTYDIDLPTGVVVRAPVRLPSGAVTSGCLRACAVGWNATRSRRLFVYYALAPPGPGAFVVQSTIVSTDHPDSRASDNSATATIIVVQAHLTLGRPVLAHGAPVAGRPFGVTVPVRRGGAPIRPARAVCAATVGARVLAGTVSLARGTIGCTWPVPPGTSGRTLRTTVRASAGELSVSGSWLYSIRR